MRAREIEVVINDGSNGALFGSMPVTGPVSRVFSLIAERQGLGAGTGRVGFTPYDGSIPQKYIQTQTQTFLRIVSGSRTRFYWLSTSLKNSTPEASKHPGGGRIELSSSRATLLIW